MKMTILASARRVPPSLSFLLARRNVATAMRSITSIKTTTIKATTTTTTTTTNNTTDLTATTNNIHLLHHPPVFGLKHRSSNRHNISFFSTATKKDKKTADNTTDTENLSYFERKKLAKAERVAKYQAKLEQKQKLIERNMRRGQKDASPSRHKFYMKEQFMDWFQQRRAYEEMMDRRARQQNKIWKIQVAVIVERLPQIVPDQTDYEREFEALQAYFGQFGKEYPPGIYDDNTSVASAAAAASSDGDDGPYDDDDDDNNSGDVDDDTHAKRGYIKYNEEILALLPEGFVPAPRITEADESGEVRTINRKLSERLYLTVQNDDKVWTFPTTSIQGNDNDDDNGETFVEASKRLLSQLTQDKVDIYYPSNAPMGVALYVYPEGQQQAQQQQQNDDIYFGTKTFFMKVQHDEGNVPDLRLMKKKKTNDNDESSYNDYAWLNRQEFIEKITESSSSSSLSSMDDDTADENFFRYLL